jgi:hypothetical protein
MQSRIERTFLNIEEGAADLVQVSGDRVTVVRAGKERPQNEQIETPLKQRVLGMVCRHASLP